MEGGGDVHSTVDHKVLEDGLACPGAILEDRSEKFSFWALKHLLIHFSSVSAASSNMAARVTRRWGRNPPEQLDQRGGAAPPQAGPGQPEENDGSSSAALSLPLTYICLVNIANGYIDRHGNCCLSHQGTL